MKISRKNYESYFIDLIDSTLPSDQLDELLDFLRENPDLSEELDGLKKIKVDPVESIKFDTKSLLKTDFDQPDIFEENCIRSIENELSEKDEVKFQSYVATHRQAENDYRLFKATLSEPDPLVVFQAKELLKRSRKISPFWYSVAAVLLIGLLFWFNTGNQQPEIKRSEGKLLAEMPVVELQMQHYVPSLVKLKEEPLSVEIKPVINLEQKASLEMDIPKVVIEIEKLPSSISFASTEQQIPENFDLAPIDNSIRNIQNQSIFPGVGELLANKVNKIEPRKEMEKFAHSALDKMKDVTNDKLSYATNNEGQVKKIEFNTKLLAFSFPVKSRK